MLAGLAAIAALNSPLPGAEPNAKDGATDGAAATAGSPLASDPSSPKKKGRANGTKDPVASAFSLAKGVELNPAQQAAYDALKQRYEAPLRQAFDDVQQADDAATTGQALKEVRECRAKIRAGIQDILAMPYREASDKASQSPSSGSEGSASSGSVPQSGNNAGYYPYTGGYYPGGYYLGTFYPAGYYPYRPHNHYLSSHGTSNRSSVSTGSSGTTAKPQVTTKPASTTTSKPASTTTSKPAATTTSKPAPKH
jgi:hypothetical protein